MAVKKYRAKKIISKLLFDILVLVIVIPILFPLYFVLISSFKNMAQVYIMPPKLFGFKPILDNYIYIFKTQHYGTYMMNSTIVAVASTALSLLLGVPAAYAIARYKMGKANTAILTARLLPNISILLPYYFIFSKLRMIDTYGVLILSHMVLSLPLIVWIMVGFFSDLPLELEEAAIVDGCTRENRFGYEEVAWLLLFGTQPTREQLEKFNRILSSYRELPEYFAEDMIIKAPSKDIMNKLGRSVLALYSYDSNPDETSLENIMRQSISLIARMPTIMT